MAGRELAANGQVSPRLALRLGLSPPETKPFVRAVPGASLLPLTSQALLGQKNRLASQTASV